MKTAGNREKLIFIVEDNAVYAKSLELYLQTRFEGIKLRVFPVGEVCLDELHLNPFLIIMDYELNSRFFDAQNGLSMIEEIRKNDPHRQIVVLSSQEDPAVLDAVKKMGCIYFKKDQDAFRKIENHISILTINQVQQF